ncbi:hypothetical protein NE237_024068 [Protea cynaroides]|uniref:TLC domain-containing protein n=1 Tax=Protea cynaroides TaxID=273540 RepID=A0A9Q0K529_9MAGN|nr:hypothetical protein NE237_024068 [Protea cynaroides]
MATKGKSLQLTVIRKMCVAMNLNRDRDCLEMKPYSKKWVYSVWDFTEMAEEIGVARVRREENGVIIVPTPVLSRRRLVHSCVISWTAAFILVRKIFPERSFSFCNRIVSTVHASLAVILSSLSVEDWRCPVCPLASKSSPSQMKILTVSFGYLVYDLICCLFGDDRVNIENAVHHLVSIVGVWAGLTYQRCGSEMVAAAWITEISSPFLHMREFLKELGYKDTDLNLAADILFAVIFSFARMVGGPYLTYVTLSADNPLLIKAMAVGLQLVSAFWFYKIARMVKYKLTKRSTSKKCT